MGFLFKSREEIERGKLEREALKLLLEVKVYPWGVEPDKVPSAKKDPNGYTRFTNSRPRVQTSSNTALAKRVLNWQRRSLALDYKPITFIRD